jgi:phosphatidylglycerophosphate synthase
MKTKLTKLWDTKNKNDEWWSSFVTAPLAVFINVLVVDWKILTPNRITFLSILVSLIASALIIWGTYPAFVLAAILINLSHIFDCMDGQMAQYRGMSSPFGSYYDKVTDQIKIFLFFAATAYAAYQKTGDITVIFLAFTGVSFYYLRVYVKYLTMFIEMESNSNYLDDSIKTGTNAHMKRPAGLGAGLTNNFIWFLKEQRKFFLFNEAVFIFLVSFALIFDQLTLVLWIFAISQVYYGLRRSWQRGAQLYNNQHDELLKPMEK